MLLSPCCQDDYFLYSVILLVHHIHCLNSWKSTLFDIDLVFRMSQGTRGQLGRNQGRDDCKAPDVVLTLASRFRVRPELEAHQVPPAHDTRTRVAAGFSTTGIQIMTLKDGNT